MYLPPPHVAKGRASYADAYSNILAAHRRSPRSSASSVVILAATDVDALCASHMLADLLRQDDVIYRIIPVSGLDELERLREELRLTAEVDYYVSLMLLAHLSISSILFSSSIWGASWIYLLPNGSATLTPKYLYIS